MATKRSKRTASPPTRSAARGPEVVHDILQGTIQELAHVGYAALRVEDVARRARVHKTTIYRRFPRKADLVQEALQHTFTENFKVEDTGALHSDLIALCGNFSRVFSSEYGRAIALVLMAESADQDGLVRIIENLRKRRDSTSTCILKRAQERGELRPDLDIELMVRTLCGTIHYFLMSLGQAPSPGQLESLVDLILHGALAKPPA